MPILDDEVNEPDEVGIVLAHLDEHVRLSRAEPGCLTFALRQSDDDPCLFDLDETYEDRAALDAHRARTQASAWGRATRDMRRDIVVHA